MISEVLRDKLETQIGAEFTAGQQYLGVAVYMAQQSLDQWAAFFYRQSDEERGHALRITHFLVDVGTKFAFLPIGGATPEFSSPLEAVRKTLGWEQAVSESFRDMAGEAVSSGDFTSLAFLQWFISEQVEEEATMGKLINLLESGMNPFEAERHLDRVLASAAAMAPAEGTE